jgi:hypothetical protein
MSETPIDLDKHRGMATQKATDIRRVVAEVEANAKLLRETGSGRASASYRSGRDVARCRGKGTVRPKSLLGQPLHQTRITAIW